MSSLRRHEGYLLIDQRNNAGVPIALAVAAGLPPGAASGLFEAPTVTCSHCQTVVVVNPDRTRARAWCKKCDHYICDGCGKALAQTGQCKPFKQIIAEVQEAADKAASIIIP